MTRGTYQVTLVNGDSHVVIGVDRVIETAIHVTFLRHDMATGMPVMVAQFHRVQVRDYLPWLRGSVEVRV